jgi:endo-1,4-beta-mannosidase
VGGVEALDAMNGYKQMRMSIWGQTAYMLASATGIQTSMIFELYVERAIKSKKLVIMPFTIVTLSSTWRKILSYVENGGAVYTSVIRGVANLRALHEAPAHLWTELFGVEKHSSQQAL